MEERHTYLIDKHPVVRSPTQRHRILFNPVPVDAEEVPAGLQLDLAPELDEGPGDGSHIKKVAAGLGMLLLLVVVVILLTLLLSAEARVTAAPQETV